MKKFITILALVFVFYTGILLAAQAQKGFSIAIAGTMQTFKASWDYNCPASLEIHFKLYVKNGDQWALIKQMDSYCAKEDQESKHFEEVFEYEISELGQDYTFGMTAVNREGVESDMAECTTHVPLPKPEMPLNFNVEVQ